MQQLSPRQRQELSQERRQRAKTEMDRYFKLPKREQLAYLDAQINRMEAALQRFADAFHATLSRELERE